MALYDYMVQKHIDIDPKDRPGTIRPRTTKIVMHYTGNPGATDEGHFNYYQYTNDRYASAHIFVDRDSALEVIPLAEVAYHASVANSYSIGIELCIEKDGSFHPDTITRAVRVVAELCKLYNLDPITDIIRHYDVTGKNCPLLWVQQPALYAKFKEDVKRAMVTYPLDVNVANFIISILSKYHGEMAGNEGVQNYTHDCANVLRDLAGIPREEA